MRSTLALAMLCFTLVPVGCADRDDNSTADVTVPAGTAVTASPPETTHTSVHNDTVVSAEDPASASTPLVGHDWVRMPVTERFPLASEPRLVFAPDGTVDGFDGCDEWSDTVEVIEGRLRYAAGTAPTSLCGSDQQLLLDDVPFAIALDGETLRLTLESRSGTHPVVDYVAIDSLRPATAESLIGTWETSLGERLTIAPDGRARFGSCDDVGVWTVDDGRLSVSGFDTDRDTTVACAGGVLSGLDRRLVELVAVGDVEFDAHLDGSRLLLTGGGETAFWLLPASSTQPELDLRTGTIFGFAPLTDVDSDFVVDTVGRTAGAPTFDSGWYSAQPVPFEDGEDCFGGREMRVVQWGDVAFGFLRIEGRDRLWITSVGDQTGFTVSTRLPVGLVPASEPTVQTPEGLGVGSTLDAVEDAGITLDLSDPDFQPVSQNADAAHAVVIGLNLVTLEVDDGAITSIMVQNPGFC